MKTIFYYKVYGNITGNIWMPQTKCSKAFSLICERDIVNQNRNPFAYHFESLRDILLHISNDGDFQSCDINECFLDISYTDGNKTVTKTYDLRESIENSDLFTEELEYIDFEY
jgi:hypothetical protein